MDKQALTRLKFLRKKKETTTFDQPGINNLWDGKRKKPLPSMLQSPYKGSLQCSRVTMTAGLRLKKLKTRRKNRRDD